MEYDLVIVGAGVAGLFAAANVPSGLKTLVLEKTDSPGKKLLLTGGGQCNLTNNELIKEFLKRYGTNGKRLRSVLFPFSNLHLIDYFKQSGISVDSRSDNKVFPVSLKSSDVLDLLLQKSRERGVMFKYNSSVIDISYQEETTGTRKFIIMIGKERFISKNILITTGGASYPQTGSDGSFISCLERIGINIIPLRPALAPIFVTDYPYGDLSGLSFPNGTVKAVYADGTESITTEGGLIFTHKGFSGPGVLKLSRYVKLGDKLIINYLPEKSADEFRMSLINAAAGDKRQISTLLGTITGLPHSFLDCICTGSKIAKSEKASRLSGHEMGILAKQLTADIHEISGTGGFATAMATVGGVDLDEVDLRTMESKRHPGLFFAGEVLDVDGDTGGYNIQFAYSSAMVAVRKIFSIK